MKAVILVGGQGTRLRPLTEKSPKPLIPVANRPFLDHVLHLLRTHGINDVLLAMSYLSESFAEAYGDGSHLGMRLEYVHEVEPLGTGGAIRNVADHLTDGEPFLVFNGDILTDLDLTDMIRFHRENGSVCTISLTSVDDPSAYGVVDMNEAGRIQRFTEKPKREEATSNWINAGTYVLEPEVLAYVPEKQHYMVERGLFPTLLAEGKPLYGYRTGAYWLDIGTPAKYLQAHSDLLAGRLQSSMQPEGELFAPGVWVGEGTFIHVGARITGPAVVGKGCSIDEGASVSGPISLGDGCRIERGAQLENLVAWDGSVFGEESRSVGCVVAHGGTVGAHSELSALSIVGDGANTGEKNILAGVKIQPNTTLPDNALFV